MVTAVVASYGRRWREGLRVVAPAAACIPALIAITPLALGQKHAFTVPAWIADFQVGQIWGLSRYYWQAAVPLLATLALVAGVILRWSRPDRPSAAAVAKSAATDPGIVALTSLALMPLALAALSLIGQPSMITRYAIPAALAWGPWIAFAVELLGRWPARVARIVLAVFWFSTYAKEVDRKRAFTRGVQQMLVEMRQAELTRLPVVFQSIHVMYPVLGVNWGRGTHGVFLELPDSTMDAIFPPHTWLYNLNKGIRVERDQARVHLRRFGFPPLASQRSQDTTARFLLLAPVARLPAGYPRVEDFGRAVLPHHRLIQVLPDLWLAERTTQSSR